MAKEQAAQLNCQNAEVVLEECDRLEHENSQLRQQVKALKQENWQLREHSYSPEPEANANFDGQEFETQDSEHHAIPVSQLTGISGKQAVRALEQLGFNVEHQNGSHIKLHRTHTQTCIVPNHPEVNPVTLKQVLRQAEVSLAAFLGAL
ncbi:MAG: addiction module toxin, HicA family [Spirulina sp. SIO3F2]|nr:addiction module toxin, HicA family [Spirulina sp. SIO3F2]